MKRNEYKIRNEILIARFSLNERVGERKKSLFHAMMMNGFGSSRSVGRNRHFALKLCIFLSSPHNNLIQLIASLASSS